MEDLPYWLDYHTWDSRRWRTAIGRGNRLSHPMRKALEINIITPDTSVLDFGCGRGSDVALLRERGINAVGYDAYYNNDIALLQPTEVVSCIYVLNTIERNWEIPEVIQFCWDLTQKTLVLAIRAGDDTGGETTIKTYQYYWKPQHWQQYIKGLGYDAEFPEAGIAVIHKPSVITNCYNEDIPDISSKIMNVKQLRSFLSVTPDKEGSGAGAPITLEYEHGFIFLTYKKNTMLVKMPFSLPGPDEKWSIIVDHTALMEALASIKAKEAVALAIVDGSLQITAGDAKITTDPWGKSTTDFDPEAMELDSQVIQFSGKRWADFTATARVAKLNKKGVNPEIVGKAVYCQAWNESISVSAWSETVSCSRTISLDSGVSLADTRDFILPLETIDLVASMKPDQVKMTLSYQFEQLLIETDIGYVLVDLPQEKYPATDGIHKSTDATVEVKRKELLNAVQSAAEAGAKNITLVFDNHHVVVEATKTKKQEVPAELADPTKKFTSTIKVAANALIDALKTLTATKILLHFPVAAANSLIIDTVTGVMYIFVVTVKVAAQLIESAADVLKKPEPEREVVAIGTNKDGSTFVVENVEISPLEPELSIEQKDEKKAKLKQEFGEKADFVESVLEVADLRERVKGIIKDIDAEVERLRSLPPSSNTAGIKDLDKVQKRIQEDAIHKIGELSKLHRELRGIVSETESVEACLDNEAEFTMEDLGDYSLKLTWVGGRTHQFLREEESQWLPQMRLIIEPMKR